ncbi:MAG: PASTA domain-containing protein [Saprospiraceae bacterium]|nr:PASTA domain-containing protein [Saprospiraceae bacterium]
MTNHGEAIILPDYSGLLIDEIKSDNDFEFFIIDSIHDPMREKASIVAQDPLPESKVKKGRKIYLTVVAVLPEQVSMPNLVDLTLRQAKSILETYGLTVSSLKYVPDIAKNAVLEQQYKGKKIEPGTLIEKGSKIGLVLGEGLNSERISVPLLIGKKQSEAISILHASSLNVGSEIFEDGNDTSKVRVYKQSPRASNLSIIKLGQSVNLWYRSEKNFNFDDYLKNYKRDSIIETFNDSITP